MPTNEELESATKKIMYGLIEPLEIWQETLPESPRLKLELTSKKENYVVIFRKL